MLQTDSLPWGDLFQHYAEQKLSASVVNPAVSR